MRRRFKVYDGNPPNEDGKLSPETQALMKILEQAARDTSMEVHARDGIYLEHGKGKREWYLTLEDMLRGKDCSKLNEPWRRRRNR